MELVTILVIFLIGFIIGRLYESFKESLNNDDEDI